MPLRRADRLFDILRVRRAASRPLTAASLADELEVTVRTAIRHEYHALRCAPRSPGANCLRECAVFVGSRPNNMPARRIRRCYNTPLTVPAVGRLKRAPAALET